MLAVRAVSSSWVVALVAAALCLAALAGAEPALRTAEEAVRAAAIARLGPGADVSVIETGISGTARVFREARLDPSARLGRPVRFTLITGTGAAVPSTATLTVIADRAITRRAIERGTRVTADDIRIERGEVVDAPLGPLPTVSTLVGGRALRTIPEGSVVLAGFVAARRVVEPGDRVTVVAAAGAVQVSAEFVAADGGRPGDVIRVVNPDTKRYVRGRIVKEGLVEVTDGR